MSAKAGAAKLIVRPSAMARRVLKLDGIDVSMRERERRGVFIAVLQSVSFESTDSSKYPGVLLIFQAFHRNYF